MCVRTHRFEGGFCWLELLISEVEVPNDGRDHRMPVPTDIFETMSDCVCMP